LYHTLASANIMERGDGPVIQTRNCFHHWVQGECNTLLNAPMTQKYGWLAIFLSHWASTRTFRRVLHLLGKSSHQAKGERIFAGDFGTIRQRQGSRNLDHVNLPGQRCNHIRGRSRVSSDQSNCLYSMCQGGQEIKSRRIRS
jgi:hypothetical protein